LPGEVFNGRGDDISPEHQESPDDGPEKTLLGRGKFFFIASRENKLGAGPDEHNDHDGQPNQSRDIRHPPHDLREALGLNGILESETLAFRWLSAGSSASGGLCPGSATRTVRVWKTGTAKTVTDAVRHTEFLGAYRENEYKKEKQEYGKMKFHIFMIPEKQKGAKLACSPPMI